MTTKTRTYLFIGLGVLVLILLVAAVVSYMSSDDPTLAGVAGAAAVAAAAAAARTRQTSRDQIDESEKEITTSVEAIHENADVAREEMAKNEEEIEKMDTDEKVALGNDLLNPNKPDRSA